MNFPEVDFRYKDEEKFIEGFKNILAQNPELFVKKLSYIFGFYNLIFILEVKYKLLYKETGSEEYLEKNIYKLFNDKDNNIDKTSFLNFNENSLRILENSFTKRNYFNPFLRGIIELWDSIFNDYLIYLKNIMNISNYILEKFSQKNPYKINSFGLNIFLQLSQDKYDKIKKLIDIQEIKKYINKKIEELNLVNNYYYYPYVLNWLDDFLKTTKFKEHMSEIEKENSNFIKYFKYLYLNCIILYNYARIIISDLTPNIREIDKYLYDEQNNFKFISVTVST